VKALNDSESWMKENNLSLDLVNIHPQFVVGRDDLITTPNDALRGTNGATPGFSAHNEDIARLQVEALHYRIPATTNGSSGIRREETNEIVARKLLDAVQSGSLLNSGSSMTVSVHLDAGETERTFGWEFQGYSMSLERGWSLS
jgi:hypothetical protein